MKPVLWIEDQADHQLAEFAGPVYASGKYLLRIAYNATEGLKQILQQEWSAIIVDLRIPPGESLDWLSIYEKSSPQQKDPRLGLELLKSVLKSANAKIQLEEVKSWIHPSRFGILTVETFQDISEVLNHLQIQAFQQKTGETLNTALLDLINQVISQQEDLTIFKG